MNLGSRFFGNIICQFRRALSAQWCALPATGVDFVWEQKKLEATLREMLAVDAARREVTLLFCNPSTSGWDCACALVIHDNDAIRADMAFRHLERRRDRAIGKQPFSTTQRDRIDHQPERIDQIMLDQRLKEITTSPNV
jgi:hypothetical protein